MTVERELKPCPFCGGEAKRIAEDGGVFPSYFVRCQACKARVWGTDHPDTAAERWNTRAVLAGSSAKVEEEAREALLYWEGACRGGSTLRSRRRKSVWRAPQRRPLTPGDPMTRSILLAPFALAVLAITTAPEVARKWPWPWIAAAFALGWCFSAR